MTQVILHAGEEYISEDLDYYFSTERDKNNQIRPDTTVVSMLPVFGDIEGNLDNLNAGTISNFFYPQLPNQLDRIYLGISVSLFSNHWGASFLIELLKLVKLGGVIILPVYPETQAAEKGYWSRSFLENIFLSRSSWKGMSNVNAENDGVMSLRVGKKWPEPRPSSIEWFYQERSNLLLNSIQTNHIDSSIKNQIKDTFNSLCHLIWEEYQSSAIVERIIQDNCNTKKPMNIMHICADYGLLINDLMLTPQLMVEQGISCHIGSTIPMLIENISRYFDPITKGSHEVNQHPINEVSLVDSQDAIILRDLLCQTDIGAFESLLKQAWTHLNTNGLLILFDDLSNDHRTLEVVDKLLSEIGEVSYYSAIVGSKIEPDVTISQYSLAIEESLRQEAKNKDKVYRVLQKQN